MRKTSTLFMVLLFTCFLTSLAMAANPLRLKYLQTVYDDGKDIGLQNPEGVTCTADYFVVADTDNNRLVKYTFHDNVAKAGEFEMPVTAPLVVQVNSKGEIFALDGRDLRIIVFNPDGSEKEYLSPKGSPVSRKMVPKSFKIGQDDKIYILDLSDKVVLVLDSTGKYLNHIPLPKESGYISDLAVNKQGTLFLVDSANPAIYSAARDDDQFALLTSDLSDYTNFPTNMALDNSGVIYLVDKHGGNLVIIGPDGSFMGHKFGYGWRESQFYYPAQLCISENKKLFIADRNNSRIQIFSAEN